MTVSGLSFGSSQFYVRSSSLVLISSYLGFDQFSWVCTHSIQGSSYRLGAGYLLINPLVPSWCQVSLGYRVGLDRGHSGNDSGILVVLQLPCHVVPCSDYLCGAEEGQIQLGLSGYSYRSVCILQGRWTWSASQQSGKSWGVVVSTSMHSGGQLPSPLAQWHYQAQKHSPVGQGYAGPLPTPPGALHSLPVPQPPP